MVFPEILLPGQECSKSRHVRVSDSLPEPENNAGIRIQLGRSIGEIDEVLLVDVDTVDVTAYLPDQRLIKYVNIPF